MVNKILTIGGIILLIILMALPFYFRSIEKEEVTNQKKGETWYQMSGISIIGHKDGQKDWLLKINKIKDSGEKIAILKDLEHGEIYEDNEVKYLLTADSGEYNRTTENFTLTHNVVIKSAKDEDEVMHTDEMRYHQDRKILKTGNVVAKNENMTIRADKMELDVDNDLYNFTGNAIMEFTIEED